MEYRQIVAITGKTGLFQLLSAQNNGAIVKNLANNQVNFIAARNHQLTPLESIEIYTTGENIRLDEAFTKIKEFDQDVVAEANSKNDKKVYRDLFRTILPDFDEDRVYASDIKKVFQWYDLLKKNDLLDFESRNKAEEADEAVAQETEASSETSAE